MNNDNEIHQLAKQLRKSRLELQKMLKENRGIYFSDIKLYGDYKRDGKPGT
jgi:transposase